MPIVYKIQNTLNDKIYIGQTSRTLDARWKSHLSSAKGGSKFRFHSAIRKYGENVWICAQLFEHGDIKEVLKKETELILYYNSNEKLFGYNATAGGTGGWVVKPEDYEKWKQNQTLKSGLSNGNAFNISNEQILLCGLEYTKINNEIPSSHQLRQWMLAQNLKLPKSFKKFRFGGSYLNLAKLLEIETGLTYNRFRKSKEHIDKIKNKITGRVWVTYKETGKTKRVDPKLVNELDVIIGRKNVKN